MRQESENVMKSISIEFSEEELKKISAEIERRKERYVTTSRAALIREAAMSWLDLQEEKS